MKALFQLDINNITSIGVAMFFFGFILTWAVTLIITDNCHVESEPKFNSGFWAMSFTIQYFNFDVHIILVHLPPTVSSRTLGRFFFLIMKSCIKPRHAPSSLCSTKITENNGYRWQ